MNPSDRKVILFFLLLFFIFLLLFSLKKEPSNKEALVYFKNELVLTIDLSQNDFYKTKGTQGDILLEVKDFQIRVVEENSPKHLCSKQGFIDKSYETIVCLPNEIVIKIKEKKGSSIDTVVK